MEPMRGWVVRPEEIEDGEPFQVHGWRTTDSAVEVVVLPAIASTKPINDLRAALIAAVFRGRCRQDIVDDLLEIVDQYVRERGV